MSVPNNIIDFFSSFILKKVGIIYNESNRYQLESRLKEFLNENKINSVDDLLTEIKTRPSGNISELFLDKATNNETSFFRERSLFECLKDYICSEFIEKTGQKHISIWSCASSSGQEPYTMAIICSQIKEKYPDFNFSILATDFSPTMVEKTKSGIYDSFQINRGLNSLEAKKYFKNVSGDGKDKLEVRPEIKSKVQVKRHNLLTDSSFKKYDIILCRNVLIYQNDTNKKNIISNLMNNLQDHGIFVMGAAEGASGVDNIKPYRKGKVIFYQKENKSNLKSIA